MYLVVSESMSARITSLDTLQAVMFKSSAALDDLSEAFYLE